MPVAQGYPRPAPAPRRALALIRVSKEREGMTSPEVQRHVIASYARANGIIVVATIEGIDESGSRTNSAWWPRLEQAISRMEAGEFDTIIVWKFSRTARNRLKWAVALDRVDVLGGTIVSATEPIETHTASGKFARGMLGEMNAYQADLIGETWKETLERRVRNGLPATGRPRFGYIWDRTYTPDPQLVPVVREMYERSVAGHGMASITRWLNEQGHRTRNGNLCHTVGTTRYMDRGFAAGFIWTKGELFPGAHEPIIGPELWAAFTARRRATSPTSHGSIRMLSGLLKCGTCEGPMIAIKTQGDRGAYGCARRSRGRSCERPMTVDRPLAEAFLTGWVHDLPTLAARLRAADEKARAQRLSVIEDRAAIERLIRRSEERLGRVTLMLVDDPPRISQAAYDIAAADLNAEIDRLRVRLEAAVPGPDSNLQEELPQRFAGWERMDGPTQNRIARAYIDRITVNPGRGYQRLKIVPRYEGTTN